VAGEGAVFLFWAKEKKKDRELFPPNVEHARASLLERGRRPPERTSAPLRAWRQRRSSLRSCVSCFISSSN
jgi:hypothetical protein